mgnify:CR=1 FL=1
MVSKNQYELIIDLLNESVRVRDIEELFRVFNELLYAQLRPLSIAAYVSIESEEKLVLINEMGGNFDQQISSFSGFSLMVRKAIKKKSVIFIPASENEIREDVPYMAVLVPFIGGDSCIGLTGMVFDAAEYSKQKAQSGFYYLLGRATGAVGHLKEQITECQKLERVNPDVMYSDKIDSLGVLSSGMAHEFNNILAVIRGYAELINMSSFDARAVQNAVRVIDEQIERGAKLIESLNVFVKGRDAQLAYFSLNEIVEEVVAMQHAILDREGIDLRIQLGDIPKVLIDTHQVREAILNVLQNSINTMPDDEPGFIEISTRRANGTVVLGIRDNGDVVTRDQADMITHPLRSVRSILDKDVKDGSQGGTGLGLAIAYGIMQSIGGVMTVSTEDDDGKDIQLIFTRTELGGEKSARYEKKEIVFFGDTRILIVDDEDPIREFLSRAFDNKGYQVIAVSNGEEAVEICAFEDIDIVFLDYLMPGIKGDKVFESIRRVSPSTEIVFITGIDEIPHVDKLMNEGLAYVLKKPFKIEKILKITNELIHKKNMS